MLPGSKGALPTAQKVSRKQRSHVSYLATKIRTAIGDISGLLSVQLDSTMPHLVTSCGRDYSRLMTSDGLYQPQRRNALVLDAPTRILIQDIVHHYEMEEGT